jgi:DNA (cytosine-5)-methyltransferase 1
VTFGSLFAGIGGIDLGLERAGMECRWQVEIDPFCRKVLEKHWPNVKRYEDVREVGNQFERVDLIAGGFPCQDVSQASNNRKGMQGERSGLWGEMCRIVRELRPQFVFVENVQGLLSDGIERVLGDLAECGYDAEWSVLLAAEVGAEHRRPRVWIVANANGLGCRQAEVFREPLCHEDWHGASSLEGWANEQQGATRTGPATHARGWIPEPDVARVADGIPYQLDRNRAIGNAVDVRCVEAIGHKIMEHHGGSDANR